MEKPDTSLEVHFTAAELRRIERCAAVERKSSDAWSRHVLSYVSQRIAKVHGETEE
jgi:hypothetical protein